MIKFFQKNILLTASILITILLWLFYLLGYHLSNTVLGLFIFYLALWSSEFLISVIVWSILKNILKKIEGHVLLASINLVLLVMVIVIGVYLYFSGNRDESALLLAITFIFGFGPGFMVGVGCPLMKHWLDKQFNND